MRIIAAVKPLRAATAISEGQWQWPLIRVGDTEVRTPCRLLRIRQLKTLWGRGPVEAVVLRARALDLAPADGARVVLPQRTADFSRQAESACGLF